MFRCARCGAQQRFEGVVEASSCCPSCGSDLHTCTNCRHFDSGAPNECRAGIEVRIAKKSSRNECGLFELKRTVESGEEARASDPRSEFDALFKF